MTLDNINDQETQEPLQEVIQETNEDLNSLKREIEEGDGVGTEKIRGKGTEERIDVNPEILKEEMRKDLKTVSSMSSEEIKAELKSYSVEITEKAEDNIIELRKLLNNARNTIAIEDKNSNIIDFHIGTYIQGESKYCTVLAQLDTMTDDEIKDMIQTEEDSDNKISYHVTFPNGDATVISEEELNS